MAATRMGYSKALVEELRSLDPTHFYPGNLRTLDGLVCWMVAEGGNAAWNPLNTTWRVEGHSQPLPGNTAGVQEYDSMAVGVEATARTLLGPWVSGKPTGETYALVLTALRAGWGASSLLQRVQRTVWGTFHLSEPGKATREVSFASGVLALDGGSMALKAAQEKAVELQLFAAFERPKALMSPDEIDAFVAGVEERWMNAGGAYTYISET
jgi:hypothetical protein